jgi:hypothetical protein
MAKIGEIKMNEEVKKKFLELRDREQALNELIQRSMDVLIRGNIETVKQIQKDRNEMISKITPEIKKKVKEEDLPKVKLNFLVDKNVIDILDENGYEEKKQ